jgi:flagellin-like hook-associated protein FlgL
MAFDISLTSGMRSDLISLQGTAGLLNRTQQRLSTGKSVNSAVDDPSKYFAAQDHINHASDLSGRKSDMGEAVQAVKAANQGITSITTLINQARGLAQSAQSASVTNRATLAAQFNSLRTQIDQMASDSGYNGKNFLKGDTLNVLFNETGSSLLKVQGFDGTSTGLGITTAATGVQALTAAHTNEGLGTNLVNGNTVTFQFAGKASSVTVLQTVAVNNNSWIGQASAATLQGSSVALGHIGVASSVTIKAAISTVSSVAAAARAKNSTLAMTDTISALPTTRTV